MTSGIVFDIRKYSIHDGPGIRTTVFLKGCPLHCAWCHNPESIDFKPELILRPNRCILCDDCLQVCPEGAVTRRAERIYVDRKKCRMSGECAQVCNAEALQIIGREMTVEQVMEEVEADRLFYDQSGGGVTFSGGEPLAQPRFLLALLQACKLRGFHTAIDTSGFAAWKVLDEVRLSVDLFLYDLKLMDVQRHLEFTRVPNEGILANLRRLSELRHNILVRIPIIPGINDDPANLSQTGAFLASLPVPPPVQLLPYHDIALAKYAGMGKEYGLAGIHSPAARQMAKIAGRLHRSGLQVRL